VTIFSRDVAIQGQRVLHNLDISKEAGGPGRLLMREFKSISVFAAT
jgi:hypothetical protein